VLATVRSLVQAGWAVGRTLECEKVFECLQEYVHWFRLSKVVVVASKKGRRRVGIVFILLVGG
jgi:hypothetical protein